MRPSVTDPTGTAWTVHFDHLAEILENVRAQADGELHDLDEVKAYSVRLAREVAARRRNPLKFVLIGVGPSVNEGQMEARATTLRAAYKVARQILLDIVR